jgi:hypothetical protein
MQRFYVWTLTASFNQAAHQTIMLLLAAVAAF